MAGESGSQLYDIPDGGTLWERSGTSAEINSAGHGIRRRRINLVVRLPGMPRGNRPGGQVLQTLRTGGEVGMIEEYIERPERTENTESIGYIQRLVRCKDCKHGYPLTDSAYIQCTRAFHTSERHRHDWFCADGEIKG